MKLETLLSFKVGCLIFATLSFLSCECSRIGDGIVLDETTHLPIDSVLVKGIENIYSQTYTDSSGSYFITTGMIGAVNGCPDIKISFSKDGYYDLTVVNPGEDNIYMKKK